VSIVASILVLLAPVALIYGWVCYFTPKGKEPPSWRGWTTLLSLILASLGILLWPVMMILMPGADWRSGIGVGDQVQWVSFWVRTVFRSLMAALLLGVLGRPRLVLPIVVGCLGTGLLWLFSTME
jgi:hypothetical protein